MRTILAVITVDQTKVLGGGAPVFYAQDKDESMELALLISKVLGAAVHDLHNGVLIIVRH